MERFFRSFIIFFLWVNQLNCMFNDGDSSFMKEGRQKYENLINNVEYETRLMKLSDVDRKIGKRKNSCWSQVLEMVNSHCKYMDEDVQQMLSLYFTYCHLRSVSMEPPDCIEKLLIEYNESKIEEIKNSKEEQQMFIETEKDETVSIIRSNEKDRAENLESCLATVRGNSFTVYTQFYVGVKSMCHFVSQELWMEKTTGAVDDLTREGERSAKLMNGMNNIMSGMVNQIDESVKQSEEMMENSKKFSETFQHSTNIMSDLFNSSVSTYFRHYLSFFRQLDQLMYLFRTIVTSLLFYFTYYIIIRILGDLNEEKEKKIYCRKIQICLMILSFANEMFLLFISRIEFHDLSEIRMIFNNLFENAYSNFYDDTNIIHENWETFKFSVWFLRPIWLIFSISVSFIISNTPKDENELVRYPNDILTAESIKEMNKRLLVDILKTYNSNNRREMTKRRKRKLKLKYDEHSEETNTNHDQLFN
ncbi:hypothetical protein SNEBB_004364 [Seison nebaliae]|nr:hypothetical protein SNEBB_004364 [Seison nebaliae]